ncbi:MAG: hypothetical protein JSS83_27075 [Cyanobacteria bacterium SZAS LIN-3]|nr:hypothetical protein [Cyanobacteria bacterium SZAS LIN-3]
MKGGSTLADYQTFVAGLIRKAEVNRARGDQALLSELEATSDYFLLMRFLWTFSIVGGPITFIAIPLLLSGMSNLLPAAVMGPLWTLSKGLMAIIFVMFLVAVFVGKKNQQ